MQNNYIKIAEFSPYEGIALSAPALLQEMGIESHTRESSRLMGKTMTPVVEIWLHENQAETGRKAIADLQNLLDKQLPSFCPKCDSERIEECSRRGWSLNLAPVFRCVDCGRKWRRR